MRNNNKKYNIILWMIILCLLSGCSAKDVDMDILAKRLFIDKEEQVESSVSDSTAQINGMETMGHGAYDCKDTAAVSKLDFENSKITLLNHNTAKEYTLDFSQIMQIKDKHNQNISMGQVQVGDIVDVCFQKSTKLLIALNKSTSEFIYENVVDYDIDRDRMEISFGGNKLSLDKRMVIRENGDKLKLEDINDNDVLRVSGVGQDVYCIFITQGHGYLRLSGAEYFYGGWISVGKQVCRITKDMILTVPVGSHVVSVRNDGHGGQKDVTIYSGEETTLNVEDLKGEEIKTGKIIFTTTPYDATILIDGKIINRDEPLELEYGVHSMIVEADGYESISQFIKIGQESATLDIKLEPNESTTSPDPDEELPEAGEVDIDTGVYYIRVTSPIGAEVYLDGVYIGVAPTSIEKKEGKHVIILKKDGCHTKSYTIQVNSEEKDLDLSFSELEPKLGIDDADEKEAKSSGKIEEEEQNP